MQHTENKAWLEKSITTSKFESKSTIIEICLSFDFYFSANWDLGKRNLISEWTQIDQLNSRILMFTNAQKYLNP